MSNQKELETLFQKHNCMDFKWINPESIIVSQWVRMKCTFGCPEYGKNASCPPSVPSVFECERFFSEYREAVVFRFATKVDKPEDRFAWTKEINLRLVKLEREVFLSGYEKSFILFMDSCCICNECMGARIQCKSPKLSRPTPEAMAVDVFATVRQWGYPIEVLSDYSQEMNRYAFLMVE